MKMFPVFWKKYTANKKDLGRAIELYVGANESEVIDVSIILTQAALELLSYLTVGRKSSKKTGKWIADSLRKGGICFRFHWFQGTERTPGARRMRSWSPHDS